MTQNGIDGLINEQLTLLWGEITRSKEPFKSENMMPVDLSDDQTGLLMAGFQIVNSALTDRNYRNMIGKYEVLPLDAIREARDSYDPSSDQFESIDTYLSILGQIEELAEQTQ